MLKKILRFLGPVIFYAVLITYLETASFILAFYVLFPILVFPILYGIFSSNNYLRNVSITSTATYYVYACVRHFSAEVLLLGLSNILLVVAFFFYRHHWFELTKREHETRDVAVKELDSFNKKYSSRIESLEHLEHQVTGLLELFEIARDLSEYLSYEGLCDILHKRVKPLFPFQTLTVLIIDHRLSPEEQVFRYVIDENQIQQIANPLDSFESEDIATFKNTQQTTFIQKADNHWVFSMLMDESISSILVVEGAESDDLAKYEVLSAFLRLQLSKIKLYRAVKELAIRDSLTGVFVRRHFLERFEEELKRSIKYSIPLAVLMLDIDHFKRYNDEYGHLAGDATLRQVASTLLQSLRRVDIVARFGGEEFVVVLPETGRESALEVAERIRSNIARHQFKIYNSETRVTVSIGLALFDDKRSKQFSFEDFQKVSMDLIQEADKALYQAKEDGRNQVCLFDHD